MSTVILSVPVRNTNTRVRLEFPIIAMPAQLARPLLVAFVLLLVPIVATACSMRGVLELIADNGGIGMRIIGRADDLDRVPRSAGRCRS